MKVNVTLVRKTGPRLADQLERWYPSVPADHGPAECKSLAGCFLAPTAHATNYAISVDDNFVGGVATSGEYLNVVWIHWNHARGGVGRRAAYAVVVDMLKKYDRVIVNAPNKKMCGMLRKIMAPSRAQSVTCRDGMKSITIGCGELAPMRRPTR